MTDTAFPFPTQTEASAPVAEETASAGQDRRKLVVVGAAVLVVLMAAGYFLFLRGGSSTDNAAPIVHHVNPAAAAAKAKADAAAKAPAKQTIPQTFDGTVGRDPFKPLVVVVATPAPTAAAAPGSAATTPSSTASQPASTPVALQRVYSQGGKSYAQLTVNGAVYAPAVGQTFAQTFQLLSVNGSAATLVQGDEQFSLKVGQVVVR